jgi:hypothetical protein
MSLLLAALFAAPLLVHFSPDRVGIRYAQTSPSGSVSGAGITSAAAESVSRRTGWRSSPGATMAQCACGCGAVAVPVGIGVALGFGSFLYENYDQAYPPLATTGIFVPAASATGVALTATGGAGPAEPTSIRTPERYCWAALDTPLERAGAMTSPAPTSAGPLVQW